MSESQPPSFPGSPPPAPPFGSPPAAPPGPPVGPPRYFYPPPPPPPASGGSTLLGCGLVLSVLLNVAALGIFLLMCLLFGSLRGGLAVEAESVTPVPEV